MHLVLPRKKVHMLGKKWGLLRRVFSSCSAGLFLAACGGVVSFYNGPNVIQMSTCFCNRV